MKAIKTLEFDQIINMLVDYAVTQEGKRKLEQLQPLLSQAKIQTLTKETTEARVIIDMMGNPPLDPMKDIDMIISLARQGGMLQPEQLTKIATFASTTRRVKEYLTKAFCTKTDLAYYCDVLYPLKELSSEITDAIRDNQVESSASKELREIRRKIDRIQNDIRSKLENLLRTKKEYFTESFISVRNGHFVLPVKKEYKHQISGTVHGASSTGATYFIEPVMAIRMQEELNALAIEESNEVNKILYILSAFVMDCEIQLRCNMEAMVALDVIFARAKLSASMQAIPASLNTEKYMKIVNGRHPLLSRSKCVPLNFEFQAGIHGIIITGPNTGGKTVALKTIGLFAMMAQSGLHLPCEDADICLTNVILCDIGDGQSITENLSTFSAHITNIIDILQLADDESLVLLDELGSGTDPHEGMGIAIAILEELGDKQCLFVATTHYPEVKEFAATKAGIMNARMAFDRESMSPKYQLEIGEAGESCALYIATRLGLPEKLIKRAKQAVGQSLHASNRSMITAEDEGKAINPVTVNESDSVIETNEGHETTPGNVLVTEQNTKISRIEKIKVTKVKEVPSKAVRFEIGDSVMVYPQKRIGLVFEKTNLKGDIGVQIAGKKEYVNFKRLQLKASAKDMYPEDYDFSIVFDTVANRKARHKMDKGHVGVQTSVEVVKRVKQ